MDIIHCTSMVSGTTTATMDKTVKLGITLPKSILHKIDQKRDDIPRSRFIRRAIERYLSASSDKAAKRRN
jgi:metal-responsive CopG/Arc/MetJ family transcriptional regulator